MKDQERINYVKALVSKEPSSWRKKAEFRKANQKWLKRSAEIALRILSELRLKGISQAELARIMEVTPQQVSKLVKGHENLTLDTISRIEFALDISLLNIEKPAKTMEQGFHPLVENANLSEIIEIYAEAQVEKDNVRPLYNYTTTKYYE